MWTLIPSISRQKVFKVLLKVLWWKLQVCYEYWKGFFFLFGGILDSASRAEFPVSLSNHVGFTPRLLYCSTHHFPESFTQLKTGWAQDAWLQWSYENWYFHLDISRWLNWKDLFGLNLWNGNLVCFFAPPTILFKPCAKMS